MKPLHILGVRIDPVDQAGALARIGEMVKAREPGYVVTANAEIIYSARQDDKMRQVINQADLVTADGSGVVWAAKHMGRPLPARVTGIDLVYGICHRACETGWRIYIIGAAPGIAQQAADQLRTDYPGCQIVGCHHGYLNDSAVAEAALADIAAKQPDILLVAMGAPRQEYWITQHMARLRVPVSMGIGGSLDVISGNLKRAPQWVQRLSLEWLYRVVIQPSRFKRVLALPKFVLAVLRQKQ